MARFFVVALIILSLSGCSDGSTALHVENQSSETLDGVQAKGSGFAAYVGTLQPGERRALKIYPRGESGLGLEFSAEGRVHRSPTSGYFEGGGGYTVKAVVTRDLSVQIEESGL